MSGRAPLLAALCVAAAVGLGAGGYLLAASSTESIAGSTVTSTTSQPPTTTTPSSASPTPDETSISPPPTADPVSVRRPRIVQDPIPYGPSRRAEMAAYARRHYGVRSSTLRPKAIVLHFTASGAGSYPGVHATFSSNAPNNGELPGVCAHFVVDQDGTIYQLVPLDLMCRHAIGLNDRAIGIEMVQEGGASSHWADQQILHRGPQIRSVLRLVRWLQSRYEIPKRNVIGHAMANDSPLFHDLAGWRNDHTDWQPEDVAELRGRL